MNPTARLHPAGGRQGWWPASWGLAAQILVREIGTYCNAQLGDL